MKKTGYYLVLSLILLLVCCKELPEASFTHDAERYEVGYPVEFTSTSINATAYDWNFGDGNSSSEMDPSHIYDQAGYEKSGSIQDSICTQSGQHG